MLNVQIHDSSHNNWQVRTNLRRNDDIRCFTVGWTYYAREKQNEIDDTCIFELVNDELPMFMAVQSMSYRWKLYPYTNCTIIIVISICT